MGGWIHVSLGLSLLCRFGGVSPLESRQVFLMAHSGGPLGHSWIWGIRALFSAFILVSIFLRNNRALMQALCMSGVEVHGINSALLKQNRHKGGPGMRTAPPYFRLVLEHKHHSKNG